MTWKWRILALASVLFAVGAVRGIANPLPDPDVPEEPLEFPDNPMLCPTAVSQIRAAWEARRTARVVAAKDERDAPGGFSFLVPIAFAVGFAAQRRGARREGVPRAIAKIGSAARAFGAG